MALSAQSACGLAGLRLRADCGAAPAHCEVQSAARISHQSNTVITHYSFVAVHCSCRRWPPIWRLTRSSSGIIRRKQCGYTTFCRRVSLCEAGRERSLVLSAMPVDQEEESMDEYKHIEFPAPSSEESFQRLSAKLGRLPIKAESTWIQPRGL